MKILNVINSIGEKTGGGATERVVQLSVQLVKRGHSVEILTTSYDLTQERIKKLHPVKIHALSCLLNTFFLPLPNLKIFISTVRNADLVHLANHWSPLNIMVFTIAKILSKPIVVSPMGALKIMGRGKIIKWIFNSMGGSYFISGADAYIAISSNELSYFSQYGVNADSVDVIPNGIEVYLKDHNEKYLLDDKLMSFQDKKYILFMGRLNPLKGADILLAAFLNIANQYPEWHLVIAGHDEGLFKSLQMMTENSSFANRVHLIGYLDKNTKYLFIKKCALFVVPSQFEAMSIVALEAGIMGVPVLLTDQCGFDDVYKINGGLVVSADIEGISDGLNRLLGNEKDLTIKGQNLQKFVISNFSWEKISYKHEEIFSRFIKS